jgi:hypothetical protein
MLNNADFLEFFPEESPRLRSSANLHKGSFLKAYSREKPRAAFPIKLPGPLGPNFDPVKPIVCGVFGAILNP